MMRNSLRILLWWWLTAGTLAGGTLAAGAELESQVDQPYKLVVCLQFSDDPGFTQLFVDSVRRQVRDQLANFFGRLAEVKVVSSWSLPGGRDAANLEGLLGESEARSLVALLEKVELAGLAQLILSPAEFVAAGLPDKLFLVTLDVDGGTHRVEWRQLDGDVQQIGQALGQLGRQFVEQVDAPGIEVLLDLLSRALADTGQLG